MSENINTHVWDPYQWERHREVEVFKDIARKYGRFGEDIMKTGAVCTGCGRFGSRSANHFDGGYAVQEGTEVTPRRCDHRLLLEEVHAT